MELEVAFRMSFVRMASQSSFQMKEVADTEMQLITSVQGVKPCYQLGAKTRATLERKSVCHICTNMCTSMIITIVIIYYCYTILIIYSMIIKYIILNIIPKQITFYQLKQTN